VPSGVRRRRCRKKNEVSVLKPPPNFFLFFMVLLVVDMYNVCQGVDAVPRALNETESYGQLLKVLLGSVPNCSTRLRLEQLYTSQRVVDVRCRGMEVSERTLKEMIENVFEVAPQTPHMIVKLLTELMLGVSLSGNNVAFKIKQFDPLAQAVRKAVLRGEEHDQVEKVVLCWALLDSGFDAVCPAVEVEEENGATTGQNKSKENGKCKEEGNTVLFLEKGEVLSDGELSSASSVDESDASDDSVVAWRQNQDANAEVEAPFGRWFRRAEDVCNAKKLDEAQARLAVIKAEADLELLKRIQQTDISSVLYEVKAAKGNKIQGFFCKQRQSI
jgi:hypothetical protein